MAVEWSELDRIAQANRTGSVTEDLRILADVNRLMARTASEEGVPSFASIVEAYEMLLTEAIETTNPPCNVIPLRRP